MDIAETLALAGLITATVGLVAAIGFGVREIHISNKEIHELKDISGGITILARGTLNAIKADGAATRQAIVDVHKSIKEELGK